MLQIDRTLQNVLKRAFISHWPFFIFTAYKNVPSEKVATNKTKMQTKKSSELKWTRILYTETCKLLQFEFFFINNFTLLQTNSNRWFISLNWPLMCTSIHYPSTSEARFLYQHVSKQSVWWSGASLSIQGLTQHLLRLHTGSIFIIVYPFMLTNQSWSLP